MPLTEEQSKRYLENLSLCPFCQSSQIVAGHIEINDGYAFQPIFCSDCGKDWEDNYTLTSVTSNVE